MRRWILWFALAWAANVQAQSSVIGYIDQVVHENGFWTVRGWTCAPGYGSEISLGVFRSDNGGSLSGWPVATNQSAEMAIQQLCGTANASRKPNYRFSVQLPLVGAYAGPITVSGYAPSGGQVPIEGSGVFGVPSPNHSETLFASASKILVFIAHQDDDIVFAPMLGKYCLTKSCRFVAATKDLRQYPSEWDSSSAMYPATPVRWGFYNHLSTHTPIADVLSVWTQNALCKGFPNLNSMVWSEIEAFRPDLIVTFDPRHGTSGHPEHRAIAQTVLDAVSSYSGAWFPDKTRILLLTTIRVGFPWPADAGYLGLRPAVPRDSKSPVYSARDPLPGRGGITGWDFLRSLLLQHPSQFRNNEYGLTDNASHFDRTTSFMRVTDYNPQDSRYLISFPIDYIPETPKTCPLP